jgi:HD-GYP domain-containing protein (c-di-GMP phosphodiesterase class II)/DNA-binding CsgD family transcriptional regulator
VRLAELVAALSLGVDLGFGQPMEHVLRESMIALRLADRIGLEDAERSTVYYTGLLVGVGCHADAHEQAKWFGDDIALKSTKYDHDFRSPRAAAAMLSMVGSGNPPLHRFRVGLEFAISGRRDLDGMVARHAAVATALAERLGLPAEVQEAVGSSYEQWDGKGWPAGLAGDRIPVAARLAQFAEFIEVAHRLGGDDAALDLAEKRSGRQFDPALCAALRADPDGILDGLDSAHTWIAVIDAEPSLRVTLTGDSFDRALLAVADFVDLKSPYTLGHARAVAELAAASAEQLDLPQDEADLLRRAGLVHDLGRLGVSNAIWDKPGPLGVGEWERVRLHPYLTERMLHQSETLAPLGAVAVQHRERLDGSGYPKGLSGGAISRPARILGVVDAYRSMREPRPHRPALSAEHAAEELRADARAGKLDAEAVAGVLAAAGHSAGGRPDWPDGLTTREVEVLRLVARGLSSKQIATELVITPKTARNHIEHIYTKIDASSRVAASLYATEQGLL